MQTKKQAITLAVIAIIAIAGFALYSKLKNSPSQPNEQKQVEQNQQSAQSPDQLKNGQPDQQPNELSFLKLPKGFSISVFAKNIGPARVLHFDPKGQIVTSVPKEGKVLVLSDANYDGKADKIVTLLSGLDRPHGLAFRCPAFNAENCKLYVAETGQISTYDYDSARVIASNKLKIANLPAGERHFTRTIAFGPDGKLYASIGSSCDVCTEKDSRRAKIFVMNFDGKDFKEFAGGLRNSVFLTWNMSDGRMWSTDMGRDLLGDDLPPDEINIVEQGKNYGWPYCYGKKVHDDKFDTRKKSDCINTEPSHVDLPAHSAPLGLTFIPREGWPEDYKNDLLVAYHGSWNRSTPTGYKIVRIKLDTAGQPEGIEDFISSWLNSSNKVLGRPVDLLISLNGSLYISDDSANMIYKVTYKE